MVGNEAISPQVELSILSLEVTFPLLESWKPSTVCPFSLRGRPASSLFAGSEQLHPPVWLSPNLSRPEDAYRHGCVLGQISRMLRVWIRVEEQFQVIRVCEVSSVDMCQTSRCHGGHGTENVLLQQAEHSSSHLRFGELFAHNPNSHGVLVPQALVNLSAGSRL